MAAPEQDEERETTVETVDEEELYGPSEELLENVSAALAEGDIPQVETLIEDLHPADVADLIEHLAPEERKLFVEITRHVIEAETISHLDETVRDEVVEQLGPQAVAEVVGELDTDDAVELLEDLEPEQQQEVLQSIPAEERILLQQGLTFPEDSAGRLMQRELVAVPSHWTVGETIDFLRAAKELPDDFYDLFVVDPTHKPLGSIPLSRAMRSPRLTRLTDIMETELRLVPFDMDQEAVAYLFKQYALVSAPVVDDAGRLIGVVTVDDVVRVIDEEAEEDLMRIVGASDTDFHAPAHLIAWQRVRWLVVTLINTMIAATVISQFQDTIQHLVALAVLMPIVAAMGGNAGVQVITVTVRALATRDITPQSNVLRIVGKELIVGFLNALVFAAILGVVASIWFGHVELGLVLAGAMIFNMVWAGFAGTLIPLLMDRLGLDPAIGAGPFLTTTTDVLGFFSFLGLATLFLT
ncbi:MAG: magnesium transporter [Rhodospirillaceae bacterium]|jgi:magnesium transporter|nr:magnesium transporter [Rhodospirillaceae bacterium]